MVHMGKLRPRESLISHTELGVESGLVARPLPPSGGLSPRAENGAQGQGLGGGVKQGMSVAG